MSKLFLYKVLTNEKIIDKHNEITQLSKEAAQRLYTADGQRQDAAESVKNNESISSEDEISM